MTTAHPNLIEMQKPKRKRRPNAVTRGGGHLFTRGVADKKTGRKPIYWFELNWHGVRTRESLHTDDHQTALDLMAKAVAEIRLGESRKKFEPITVRAMYDTWIAEKERTAKASTHKFYQSRWKHLEPVFGDMLATQVNKDVVSKYLTDRKREGAGNILQNREQRVLMMIFEHNRKKISANDFPEFPAFHSEKAHVRQGRLSKADFQTIMDRLSGPENFWFRTLVTMTFKFGFRRAELQNATVGYFDAKDSSFTLPTYSTKNKMERRVPIKRDGEIYKMLVKLTAGRPANEALFIRSNGEPVKDYRRAWDKLTEGITNGRGGHVTIHDLRRSAISEAKAKGFGSSEFGTHLTADVFNRYVTRTEVEEQANAERIEE
jgi:integrase